MGRPFEGAKRDEGLITTGLASRLMPESPDSARERNRSRGRAAGLQWAEVEAKGTKFKYGF